MDVVSYVESKCKDNPSLSSNILKLIAIVLDKFKD